MTTIFGQSDYSTLENSKISVSIHNGNSLFMSSDQQASFNIKHGLPGIDDPATTFVGALWIAGYNANNDLQVGANTYQTGAQTGVSPGPLDDNGDPIDNQITAFDRIFSISNEQIESFKLDFADGTIDDDIPQNILEWPGRNSDTFDEAFGVEINPNKGYAPFFDQNGDGNYSPFDGDYPEIKGAFTAKYVMFSFSKEHPFLQSDPMKIEAQVLARVYEEENESLDQTIFYDYTLTNRNEFMYTDFIISMFIDPDLGCYTDDYIGFNEECEFAYTYNQDAVDGTVGCDCPPGIPTFCEEIPVMGYTFIKKPLITVDNEASELGLGSFIYMINTGIGDPPPAMGDPNSDSQYYSYMKGLWMDEVSITAGGSGYNPGSNDAVSFALSGNPANDDEWSLCSEDQIPFDRRMLLNLESFDFLPGQQVNFTFAGFSYFGSALPCVDHDLGVPICEEIKAYESGQSAALKEEELYECLIFPNALSANEPFTVDCKSDNIKSFCVMNSQGQKVINENSTRNRNSIQWNAPTLPGVYFVHLVFNNNERLVQRIMVH